MPSRAAQGNSPKTAFSPWKTLFVPKQDTPHWSEAGKNDFTKLSPVCLQVLGLGLAVVVMVVFVTTLQHSLSGLLLQTFPLNLLISIVFDCPVKE